MYANKYARALNSQKIGRDHFFSIPKKRDLKFISLVSDDIKIIFKIIQVQQEPYIERKLSDVQAEFRK